MPYFFTIKYWTPASEVDRTLIHYDVPKKEVVAMVYIKSLFRYHIIRLHAEQTTSGQRGLITS